MLGFGFGMSSTKGLRGLPPVPVELQPLQYFDPDIVSTAEIGSVVQTLLGRTPGSTLSIFDDPTGLFAIDNAAATVIVGASLTGNAGTHTVTVREELAGATNSPLDTVIFLNVQPIYLDFLTLDGLTVSADAAPDTLVGTIGGFKDGSTVEVTVSADYFAAIQVGGEWGLYVSGDLSALSGPMPVQLTETNPNATAPQTTDFEIDVLPV